MVSAVTEIELSVSAARRLALTAQGLDADRVAPDRRGIVGTIERLRWLQLDPTSAVARSHLLVLWSRLGPYDVASLERLIYRDRRLFEWRAFIYPMRHLPFYRLAMRELPRRGGYWARRAAWMRANDALRRNLLARLRRDGPLPTSAFDGRTALAWQSTGWTNERNASQMLEFLSAEGRVMVAGRDGQERLWDLADRCIPDGALAASASPSTLLRDATLSAARALGIATTKQIAETLPWSLRPRVVAHIATLARTGDLVEARITSVPGTFYMRRADLASARRLEREFAGRVTLLSPFDNLIRDRARTEALFGMRFRLEIYVPRSKREFGFFVMPILRGDQLIGRLDPKVDRERGVLAVNAVHLEKGVHRDTSTGRAIGRALRDLAGFVGAREVEVARSARLPGLA